MRPASNFGAAMGESSTLTSRTPSFGLVGENHRINEWYFWWYLESRGSVTVALTWARTLVFPSVTWSQKLSDQLYFKTRTWQEPQSEPKLTDKSLVSIHPLPSNLRPSHNAWQHCKTCLTSSRHELAQCTFNCFNIRTCLWIPPEENSSHRTTQVSLSSSAIYSISHQTIFLLWRQTGDLAFWMTRNRKHLSTIYKSQILGSCWYQLGQVHVPTLWLLIWQDHRFWWLRAKTIWTCCSHKSDKKVMTSSAEKYLVCNDCQDRGEHNVLSTSTAMGRRQMSLSVFGVSRR